MALLSMALIHARGHRRHELHREPVGHPHERPPLRRAHHRGPPARIEDELARGRIVIVAGYQGMSYEREITTLGPRRLGHDRGRAGRGAGAERCEIYSDVDGIYSADPRSVADARPSEHRLRAMQEMAEAGAKVLNARAVDWAKRHRS